MYGFSDFGIPPSRWPKICMIESWWNHIWMWKFVESSRLRLRLFNPPEDWHGSTKSWRLDGSDDFLAFPFVCFVLVEWFCCQLQHGGNLQGECVGSHHSSVYIGWPCIIKKYVGWIREWFFSPTEWKTFGFKISSGGIHNSFTYCLVENLSYIDCKSYEQQSTVS